MPAVYAYAVEFQELVDFIRNDKIDALEYLPAGHKELIESARRDINQGARSANLFAKQHPEKAETILTTHAENAKRILDALAKKKGRRGYVLEFCRACHQYHIAGHYCYFCGGED